MVKRLTRIFYKDTFFDYPLKPFNALNGLGFSESFACIFISAQKAFPPKDTSKFDGWVIKRFGKDFLIFFSNLTVKNYGVLNVTNLTRFCCPKNKKIIFI